jgi:hypothetical protein
VDALEERFDIIRIFQDQVSAFTAYPFSKTTRVEFGGGISRSSYMVTRFSTYYTNSGTFVERNRISIDDFNNDPYRNPNLGILRSFTLMQASTALVGDNSYFGIAAPLSGFRYRLQAEYDFGSFKFFSPTIDLRKYVRIKPVTIAGRLNMFGRFGKFDSNAGLYPYYLGYPFLIRGYEFGNSYYSGSNVAPVALQPSDIGKPTTNYPITSQLSGSRIALANFEVRIPFTGPEKLAQIKSKFLFSDLNFFFDAGLAWDSGDKIDFARNPRLLSVTRVNDINGQPILDSDGNEQFNATFSRVPLTSLGVSLRVNFFGALILEPYYAYSFNRTTDKKFVFGLNFTPGW